MQETTKRKIWKWLGYTLFFMAAFVYFMYRTFPYKQLFDRFSMNFQRQAKVRVKMSNLHPYWLSGVEANNVIIRKPMKKGIAAVQIKYVRAHASLFGLLFRRISADFYAEVAKGTIEGSVNQSGGKVNVKLDIKRLSLNALREKRRRVRRRVTTKKGKAKAAKPKNDSLLATLFAPVYGRLKAKVRLKVPMPGAKAAAPKKTTKKNNNRRRRRRRTRRRRAPARGVDMTKATGTIKVDIRSLSLGPGEFPTAQMGDLPVPLLRLGKLVLRIKIAKGTLRVTRCESNGADGALKLTGSIRLRRNMRYAVFRGKLEFKINKSFIDGLDPTSVLKTGLGLLGPAPNGGFYRYRLRIPLGGGRATFRRF